MSSSSDGASGARADCLTSASRVADHLAEIGSIGEDKDVAMGDDEQEHVKKKRKSSPAVIQSKLMFSALDLGKNNDPRQKVCVDLLEMAAKGDALHPIKPPKLPMMQLRKTTRGMVKLLKTITRRYFRMALYKTTTCRYSRMAKLRKTTTVPFRCPRTMKRMPNR